MKILLNDANVEIIKKAEKVMGTDYERKGNYIDLEGLICIIRDLLWEIDNLEEKIEDRERDIEENYKQIVPSYSYYGLNERDFH